MENEEFEEYIIEQENKLKQLCQITEYEINGYIIILPSFMNILDVQRDNIYYKKWCELVGSLNHF